MAKVKPNLAGGIECQALARKGWTIDVTAQAFESVAIVGGFDAKARGYSTTPLGIDEWPEVASDSRPADLESDIFLLFEGGNYSRTDTSETFEWNDPRGISGAGIWDLKISRGQVWAPRQAVLIGIETSWYEPKKYLRGVQISHWLRLVASDYPDYQEDIALCP